MKIGKSRAGLQSGRSLAAAAILGVAAQACAAAVWPHEGSDLEPDPAVRWGVLENGFAYAIRPNDTPKDRVSLRLLVKSGSLAESEEQRGLAHFIQHMAFKGTQTLPAEEMVRHFQRLGMKFGADTNAQTGFEETVFQLELPNSDAEVFHTSLRLLRDYADGILFEEKAIGKERGVILSEKLKRDDATYRTLVAELSFLFPHSIVGDRMPIGLEKVILEAPRERLLEYYKANYRPDNMVLVLVGAVDVDPAEALIRDTFSSMEKPEEPLTARAVGLAERGAQIRAKLHTEQDAPVTTIGLSVHRPYENKLDNSGERFAALESTLANQMINRRLERLAKGENAPFVQAGISSQSMFRLVEQAQVRVVCQQDRWEAVLQVAEQELRRALEHGFDAAELAEAKAVILSYYENLARSAATRLSAALSTGIVERLMRGKVFTSPESDLPRIREALGRVTTDGCRQALQQEWEGPVSIFVAGNLEMENSGHRILEAYRRSRGDALDASESFAAGEFAYRDFGPAGSVARRSEVEDLGITQIVFDNEVRLNLKATPYEKGRVQITARFGNGLLDLPQGRPGLALFASTVFSAGGLEQHGQDELQSLFAGKEVNVSFRVDEDACILAGQCSRTDLETQLLLMCAYLIAPGYREDGTRLLGRAADILYRQIERSPEGVLQGLVQPFVRGDDYRFAFPTREELMQRNLDELKEWLGPALSGSYLEVSLVGDFDVEEALNLAAETFGAIPGRAAAKDALTAQRVLRFPRDQRNKVFTYQAETPKALTSVYWPTIGQGNMRNVRRLNLLASILTDRLREKVREDLGQAYSPQVISLNSDAFRSFGYLNAQVTSEVEAAPEAAQTISVLAADLSRTGATEDELKGALEPMLTLLREQREKNAYWLNNVLASCQEQPQRLEWARTLVEDVETAQLSEINQLAKQFLPPSRSLLVQILPGS
ncbi:MAG TPA: insulinase family protein [Verrucomicrobiales bacterium]|nr:insulinase family protein [Verrucomicrobiales bacterium]